LGFDEQSVNSAGLGGLLHDTGKAKIDNKIINKTVKLTEIEFNIAKEHVAESRKIIDQIPDIPEISKQIICEHHENYDGSGYPKGLKGDKISKFGRIAAICDVYDAIAFDRLYRKGLIPNKALSKIFEWRGSKFDRLLVEQFIHTIGIYPTGSFVMLESGRVALVIQQNGKSLLTPIIKVFYDSIIKKYVKPVEVDLSEGFSDRIADAVSPLKLKLDINPMDILLTL
jgi:HD-GYP domain-containing protein (c-di-GMP phosphodiesterase class II)